MSEQDTMISGIFTATLKSLKVLQNMQKKQGDLFDVMSGMSDEQKVHLKILQEIRTKPEPEILGDIKDIVTDMTKSMNEIDLDGIIRNINAHTSTTVQEGEKTVSRNVKQSQKTLSDTANANNEQVIETIKQTSGKVSNTLKNMDTHISEAHEQEINELIEIKKSSNLEALRKLIGGLKNQQENMNKLASYIQVLSENVQSGRKDTLTLASTIQESGARIKSMDFRMAAMTGEETSDVEDLNQSLELLTSISQNGESDIELPDLNNTSHIDELNELVNDLDVE